MYLLYFRSSGKVPDHVRFIWVWRVTPGYPQYCKNEQLKLVHFNRIIQGFELWRGWEDHDIRSTESVDHWTWHCVFESSFCVRQIPAEIRVSGQTHSQVLFSKSPMIFNSFGQSVRNFFIVLFPHYFPPDSWFFFFFFEIRPNEILKHMKISAILLNIKKLLKYSLDYEIIISFRLTD